MNPPDKVPVNYESPKGEKTQVGWAKVRGNNVVIQMVPTQLADSVKDAITKNVINGLSVKVDL